MRFIVDGLATGRIVSILTVVDVLTRECLVLEADTNLGSGRVTRVLGAADQRACSSGERALGQRAGVPSRRMRAWSEGWKVGLVHIQPGRSMQNGHVEGFHERLRDECLNASLSRTLNDARCTLANWRQEYNWERPHS